MIGTKAHWMTGALTGAALLLGSVGTAQARPRPGGGWHHHDRRGNGFGVGDAIGVAALLGAAAIVVSSVSKNRQAAGGPDARANTQPPVDPDYDADSAGRDGPPPVDEDFSDVANAAPPPLRAPPGEEGDDFSDGPDGDAPPPADGTDYGADRGWRDDARATPRSSDTADQFDAMTDACAVAARAEAQGQGGYAEIRQIDTPRPTREGGYDIDGQVESRASFRAAGGDTRRFTCSVARDGTVRDVYLSRDSVAR